ncbi:MAG: helix-turn-helix domain-containing protein [Acidobacteriota bacterium]
MTQMPPMSFGEELRRQRLVREISLEEISSSTKISVRLLTALEASDVEKLPAPTFTRGFIRAYAIHLGIDPDEKVNAYLADLAGGAPDAPTAKHARPRSRFWRGRGRRSTAGSIFGGIVGLLLLLGWVASSARRGNPVRERAAPAAAPVAFKNVSVSTSPSPIVPSRPGAVTFPAAASGRVEDPADMNGVSLVLDFDDDSWTKLEADGQMIFSGMLRRGESKRFEARHGFRLTLGNAGAVRVTVDGHSLERLGAAGEVVRDRALPGTSARG